MILINLLPHREATRKRRRDAFHASLGMVALACGLLAALVYLWYQGQITWQQAQNLVLLGEIERLEKEIKEIAVLETEITALRARQQAVENLQADRNQPIHLLDELVKQLPDGVYLTSLRQENQDVALQGVAQSNERVSELLRNLANNSPWLTKPELVEIVASGAAASSHGRISNFTIRVNLRRASEVPSAFASAARS